MITLFDSVLWITSPNAYWTIKYEYQRNGVDMQYRFYWKVWLRYSSSWYSNGLQLQLFLNGVKNNITVKGYNASEQGWSYEGTTGWYTVSNKTSGTTPFYAVLYDTSASVTKTTSSSYSLTVSACMASLTSAPDFTDESNPTITYSNPAGNNVTSLQACITLTGAVDDVVYRDVPKNGTSYTFELTEDERNVLRNATKTSNTRTVEFFLRTVVSGATFHSGIKKTLTIVNATPTYAASQISYADTASKVVAVTGNNQHIVQNKSTVTVTFGEAKGNKGATISKYSITLNGVTKTVTESGSVGFGSVNSSNDLILSVTATDSRGNTTTVTKTVTMLAYTEPTFTAVLERLNNYEETTYLTVKANVASVNGKNTTAITYRYMQNGGTYGEVTAIDNNTKYTLSCDNRYAYTFKITVIDAFSGVTKNFQLPKGKFPLFIDTEKNAVGINDFPSGDEALCVAGGVARFDDGIVLVSGAKKFKITISDNGTFVITEIT